MLNEKAKNIRSFFFRLAVSAGLLIWLFRKIDLSKMGAALQSADIRYLFVVAVIFLFINFIILWRWYVFTRALELKMPFGNIARWFFIGLFCNLFLPTAIGGDIIKAIGLCRDTPQKVKVFASIVLDRLSGFAGIVVVATIAFAFGHRLIQDFSILVSIVIMTVVSLWVLAILFNSPLYTFVCQIFNWSPKIKEALMKMHYDILLLKGKSRQGLMAIGLSCLAQMTLAIVFYFMARGLHQNIQLVYFLIFSPMVCVATTLPSIGGLGVREVGWVYLLSKVGVAEGVAVSMSLINFSFMVIVGLIGGIVYVSTLSSRRIQYHDPNFDFGSKEIKE